jgi:site-specific recombinase XerC
LLARKRPPRTIQSYGEAVAQLVGHAGANGLADLSRSAVRAYLADQADRYKPATVAVRFRSLQQWFRWLVDEGELEEDPMARMKPPTVPEQPVPVLSPSQQRSLPNMCEGKDFVSRRDTAVLLVFLDTGMRLSELTGPAQPRSATAQAGPCPRTFGRACPIPTTGTPPCGSATGDP